MCAAPIVELRADRYECADECGFVNYDNPTPVAAVEWNMKGKWCSLIIVLGVMTFMA